MDKKKMTIAILATSKDGGKCIQWMTLNLEIRIAIAILALAFNIF